MNRCLNAPEFKRLLAAPYKYAMTGWEILSYKYHRAGNKPITQSFDEYLCWSYTQGSSASPEVVQPSGLQSAEVSQTKEQSSRDRPISQQAMCVSWAE